VRWSRQLSATDMGRFSVSRVLRGRVPTVNIKADDEGMLSMAAWTADAAAAAGGRCGGRRGVRASAAVAGRHVHNS